MRSHGSRYGNLVSLVIQKVFTVNCPVEDSVFVHDPDHRTLAWISLVPLLSGLTFLSGVTFLSSLTFVSFLSLLSVGDRGDRSVGEHYLVAILRLCDGHDCDCILVLVHYGLKF